MSNIIKVVYDEIFIPNYMLKVLADNECNLFLPVTFTHVENKTVGIFSTDGYANISDVAEISLECALTLFTDAVYKMKEAMNRFVFPEEYEIKEDCIFTDIENRSIKCIFSPASKKKEDVLAIEQGNSMMAFEKQHINEVKSIYTNIKKISDIIKLHSSQSSYVYIDKAVECLESSRYGIDYALQRIAILKKEAYKLGIDRKISLREQ